MKITQFLKILKRTVWLLIVVFLTIKAGFTQAYFGFPYTGSGFPYAGFSSFSNYPFTGYNYGLPANPFASGFSPIYTPYDLNGGIWSGSTIGYDPFTSGGISVNPLQGTGWSWPYYQQSYNGWPFSSYYASYSNPGMYPSYNSFYSPFNNSGLGYNLGFGPSWLSNPWYSSYQYNSPWSYLGSNQLLSQPFISSPLDTDDCNLPGTGLYAKPAIYLYPQKDTYVKVELEIDGQLTQTIPSYDDGWYVLAKPDGDIFDRRDGYVQDKPYDYLFWEADSDLSKLELPDQGWVVAKDNLETWFSENLPKLGLNEKEKAQFMEYWLERLSKSPYYELKLLSIEYLAEHAKLIINPQPDTLIRVIFNFRPLDEMRDIGAPILKTPARKGFVALEWGGILNKGKEKAYNSDKGSNTIF